MASRKAEQEKRGDAPKESDGPSDILGNEDEEDVIF